MTSPLVLFFDEEVGRGGRAPIRVRGATPTVVESFRGTATALVRCPCNCDGIVGEGTICNYEGSRYVTYPAQREISRNHFS